MTPDFADIATGHGEQSLAPLAFDSDQLRSQIAAQLWAVEQQRVEIGQQIKQMEFPGRVAGNPEQRFGLRVGYRSEATSP